MRTLHTEIENNNIKGIRDLLIKGFDRNKKDDLGQTPLHRAVNYESVEIIELLIMEGADVNAINNDGESPMFMVSSYDIRIIKLLLEYGADPNIKNDVGRTILDEVYEGNVTDIIELLQSHGAKSIIKKRDF